MSKKHLPDEVLIYQCDTVDDQPIYAVARNVDEIPEDFDGTVVGVFVRNKNYRFNLKRELK